MSEVQKRNGLSVVDAPPTPRRRRIGTIGIKLFRQID